MPQGHGVDLMGSQEPLEFPALLDQLDHGVFQELEAQWAHLDYQVPQHQDHNLYHHLKLARLIVSFHQVIHKTVKIKNEITMLYSSSFTISI